MIIIQLINNYDHIQNSILLQIKAMASAAASAREALTSEAAKNFLHTLSASHALNPPSNIELKESSKGGGLGVWAAESIPSGTRFGPFLGKWALEPINLRYAWEVSEFSLVYFTLYINLLQLYNP